MWVRDNKVWYESELINSIAKIAQDIVDNDCYENSDVKAQKILELIQENKGCIHQ